MEEGIVVELGDSQDLVWMTNRSRAIPVPHSPRTKRFKIGTTIRIWYSNVGEIMEIEEACSNGSLTVTGNEIKIRVRVIFPPRKLLSKCGLKLFSRSIGIVSANETWRDLFTMAVPVLYEAIIVWCSSSREFVLAPDQTLVPLKDEYPLPTYLEILRDSPWVDLIEVPKKADEIFQEKVEGMIPSYRRHGRDSSSSSDDGIPHTVSPNDFVKIGILFGRKYNDEWEVFVLDCDEMRNQWTIVTERNLNKYCEKPYIGATIEIDLNRFVHFKVDEWCVVDHDDTVVGKNINGIVMLDVAVRVKNIVSIGDKRVTKMHNRRVMDVYDYNNVLGKLEIGEIVSVLIKWSRIDRDKIRDRKEWVVHTYGSGETVMPESRKVKRMKKLDRSLKEYCLVEYACDRDWNDNELLRNYRAEYNRHLEEEKWEEARIKQNEAEIEEEEEFIRRKEGIRSDRTEEFIRQKMEGNTERSDETDEFIRRKLEGNDERKKEEFISHKEESEYDATEEFIRLKMEGTTVSEEREETTPSHKEEFIHRKLEKMNDIDTGCVETKLHTKELPSQSFHIATQSKHITKERPQLPIFGANLIKSRHLAEPSNDSGCSLNSSSMTIQQNMISDRERRALALMRRMGDIIGKNPDMRKIIDREDSDWIDDTLFVLNEYRV